MDFDFEINSSRLLSQTFRQEKNLHKLKKTITLRLQQINKSATKTIHSPDGDIIDCVISHKQPAFDHPLLKGHKLLNSLEIPREHNQTEILSDNFQLWSLSGETCPEGTIPIRRTKEQEILKDTLNSKSERKFNIVQMDATNNRHEYAIGTVTGDAFYGATANINVWAPHVESNTREFSLSQIWVLAGTFGKDLNSIEAGWQVYPSMYGDNQPRLFIYWTSDAYKKTGCYNLHCPGFVQTSKQIVVGAAIRPISTYNGKQFEIKLSISKDPKNGHWWLKYGSSGHVVGYWPSSLFTHLNDKATMIQFGGEIVNSISKGSHTSTQMGSGHFAGNGFGKASYFKHMQVMNFYNKLIPLPNLRLWADKPNCYSIKAGTTNTMGNYIYYGGPGKSAKCP
ncbi:protein neprosin-like [Cicer arietinum]|uniref:protein neprosin-like n=1 Tax=Cicer arietinum TaxID=3827 RepID=UPI003CC54DD4